ncbi:MAG: polysaccharide deacetylase family protein [Nitrospira sp.]
MPIVARLKSLIKYVVAHSLYAVGVLQLLQRIMLRRRAVVLMYHRVLTEEEMAVTASHPAIVVKRETFAAQMEVVKKRFHVMTVDEFVERMERRIPFEDSSCLVTFDDGWKDNFTHALPILRRFQIPSLVFLPMNFIGGTRLFWQERLTWLVKRAIEAIERDQTRRSQLASILAPIGLAALLEKQSYYTDSLVHDIVRKNKTIDVALLNETINQLTLLLNVELDELLQTDDFLDWDQVKMMAECDVAFGGHGMEHRILTAMPVVEAIQEIYETKKMLDARLNQAASTFSYPNGDWSPEIAKLVEKAGFRAAFTTEPGFVRCDDDRFAIHRINIYEHDTKTIPLFLARIVGLS